jgi:ribonuclease P protein component
VRRNHLRRIFREKFRRNTEKFLYGSDFLVIFLPESKKMDSGAMGEDFFCRLRQISIVGKAEGRRT